MLTARDGHAERVIGLDSGADDYIVKPFDPEEVVARANAVLRRLKGRVQQVLTCDYITLNETTRSVTVNHRGSGSVDSGGTFLIEWRAARFAGDATLASLIE